MYLDLVFSFFELVFIACGARFVVDIVHYSEVVGPCSLPMAYFFCCKCAMSWLGVVVVVRVYWWCFVVVRER